MFRFAEVVRQSRLWKGWFARILNVKVGADPLKPQDPVADWLQRFGNVPMVSGEAGVRRRDHAGEPSRVPADITRPLPEPPSQGVENVSRADSEVAGPRYPDTAAVRVISAQFPAEISRPIGDARTATSGKNTEEISPYMPETVPLRFPDPLTQPKSVEPHEPREPVFSGKSAPQAAPVPSAVETDSAETLTDVLAKVMRVKEAFEQSSAGRRCDSAAETSAANPNAGPEYNALRQPDSPTNTHRPTLAGADPTWFAPGMRLPDELLQCRTDGAYKSGVPSHSPTLDATNFASPPELSHPVANSWPRQETRPAVPIVFPSPGPAVRSQGTDDWTKTKTPVSSIHTFAEDSANPISRRAPVYAQISTSAPADSSFSAENPRQPWPDLPAEAPPLKPTESARRREQTRWARIEKQQLGIEWNESPF